MLLKSLLPKITLVAAGFFVGLQSPHGVQGPTTKEIIEILAEYDVQHVAATPGVPYYGATDMEKRVIYIIDNQDVFFKRMTVIHELMHVVNRIRLRPDDEDEIKLIEEAEYKRLFVDGN